MTKIRKKLNHFTKLFADRFGEKSSTTTLLLFMIITLEEISSFLLAPIIANMNRHHSTLLKNLSDHQLHLFYGLLLAITPIFYCIGAPLLGFLSDQFGRKKILTFSLSGTLISYIFYVVGFMQGNIRFLFVARAIEGLTNGGQAIAQAIISDLAKGQSSTKHFGVIGAALTVGLIIGPLGGGLFAHHPSLLFSIVLGITSLNLLFLMRFFRETLIVTAPQLGFLLFFTKSFSLIQKNCCKLFPLLLIFFLFELGWSLYYFSLALSLSQYFNLTATQVGLFLSSVGIILFLSLLILLRYLLHYVSNLKLLRWALVILVIGTLIASLSHFYFFVLGGSLIAISIGLAYPCIIALISERIDKGEQGLLMGLSNAILAIAFAISQLLTGVLFNISMHLAYLVASVFFGGALIMIKNFKYEQFK